MGMNVRDHSDVRSAMRYQHPTLDAAREAIDQRDLRHNQVTTNSGYTEER